MSLCCGRLIGPVFHEGTLTGQRYLKLLQDSISDIDENLMETFQNQVIGYGGFVEWPPRSPDLTSLDFFLWGHIKGQTRILKRDRRTILPQITADYNDGASTSVSVRTVQRTVIHMGSRSQRPTRVPLLTALLYSSSGHGNTTIGLLMTRNTLPGLTSLVSNCIGRMHVYEYGDNIINP
ncbi:hypothetical protein AVEN_16766-1 [Araneus ventricosus]|uniref:Uncharacterized protein n=1 Tax=Araneus ventricosus TaxID=182803 RepID=A0A4Y2BQK4_ARAVE|nr:hypothetical protein AVEN_16766-1 [Araneus ventricosus]